MGLILAASYAVHDFGLDYSDAVLLAASISGLVDRKWKSCYNVFQSRKFSVLNSGEHFRNTTWREETHKQRIFSLSHQLSFFDSNRIFPCF